MLGMTYWQIGLALGLSGATLLALQNHRLNRRVCQAFLTDYDTPCCHGAVHPPSLYRVAHRRIVQGWAAYAATAIACLYGFWL